MPALVMLMLLILVAILAYAFGADSREHQPRGPWS